MELFFSPRTTIGALLPVHSFSFRSGTCKLSSWGSGLWPCNGENCTNSVTEWWICVVYSLNIEMSWLKSNGMVWRGRHLHSRSEDLWFQPWRCKLKQRCATKIQAIWSKHCPYSLSLVDIFYAFWAWACTVKKRQIVLPLYMLWGSKIAVLPFSNYCDILPWNLSSLTRSVLNLHKK